MLLSITKNKMLVVTYILGFDFFWWYLYKIFPERLMTNTNPTTNRTILSFAWFKKKKIQKIVGLNTKFDQKGCFNDNGSGQNCTHFICKILEKFEVSKVFLTFWNIDKLLGKFHDFIREVWETFRNVKIHLLGMLIKKNRKENVLLWMSHIYFTRK